MVQMALGGLGLFLLGMKLLSDGMQAIAGEKLNRLICSVTDNRVLAIIVGIIVTTIIQSSSATTVMVVGFVNSGLMTLMQSIGVIFGANIGTTLSLWLLAIPGLADYGAIIVGASAFVYLFAKKDRTRFIGMSILGLGLIFFGLDTMSGGFKPLGEKEGFIRFLTLFEATSTSGFIKAVLAGTIFTAVVQSSAAVVVIAMGFAGAGVIGFPTAVAIVLGSNIGTTATALLACIGANRNASRSAIAHSLFNIIGVIAVVAAHEPFIRLTEQVALWIIGKEALESANDFRLAIAVVHTLFNVVSTLVLFPFMGALARLCVWLLPVRKEESKADRYKPQYLDPRLLQRTPAIALAQAEKEILLMGDVCVGMLDDLKGLLSNSRDAAAEEAIFHGEDNMDVAQKSIAEYVSALLHDSVTHEIAANARREIRQADEFESVSDHIRNALKAYLKIRNADESLSDEAVAEVLDLCAKVRDFGVFVNSTLRNPKPRTVAEAQDISASIDDAAKKYREAHMHRIATSCSAPVKSLVYSDLLTAFRRANDHLLNVVETLQ